MEQRGPCSVSGVISGSDPDAPTASQATLNLPGAWQFPRGEGQLVAVIDTGVRPGPRLPNVEAGGDFVESTDGLTDCDGHGTLVAGIIAGQPGDQGDIGQVLATDVGRRSAGGSRVRRCCGAGPGDRARGRPRRPGDQHLGDNVPAG
jgi:membrane-anchored mycosin MYCP